VQPFHLLGWERYIGICKASRELLVPRFNSGPASTELRKPSPHILACHFNTEDKRLSWSGAIGWWEAKFEMFLSAKRTSPILPFQVVMVVGRMLARSVRQNLGSRGTAGPGRTHCSLLPTTERRRNEVNILDPDGRSLLDCGKHAWKPMILTGIKSTRAYPVQRNKQHQNQVLYLPSTIETIHLLTITIITIQTCDYQHQRFPTLTALAAHLPPSRVYFQT